MSAFLTPLKVTAIMAEKLPKGPQVWVLDADLLYRSDLFGDVSVPAGFSTDFASIPSAFKRYIDDDSPGILSPSVVHDYLYANAGQLLDGRVYDRELADRVLREAMASTKRARADQCFVVYHIVRMFGSSHWLPSSK